MNQIALDEKELKTVSHCFMGIVKGKQQDISLELDAIKLVQDFENNTPVITKAMPAQMNRFFGHAVNELMLRMAEGDPDSFFHPSNPMRGVVVPIAWTLFVFGWNLRERVGWTGKIYKSS